MPDAAAELTVERVLCAVECIPTGRVVSYGDLAELVGTSARRVGAIMASAYTTLFRSIMASAGPGVPWWRVVNASGRLPGHLVAEASRRWADEGTPAVDGRCVMSRARADLPRLAADHETRLAEWGNPARELTSPAGQ